MRIVTVLCAIVMAALVVIQPSVVRAASQSKQPNIVLVVIDDLGSRDLGCYGSELYETPAIDQLASQGVQFTNAYATYPRCVPSRFGLFTGQHPARAMGANDGVKVDPQRQQTVATVLKKAGYATFYCGKWHLGAGPHAPTNNGFDVSVAAGAAGATGSHFAPYNEARLAGHKAESPIPDVDEAPEGEYLTDRLTTETVGWIRKQATSRPEQPFFAVLAHYAVHTPLEAKPEPTQAFRKKIRQLGLPQQAYEPEGAAENLKVQNNPTYAAMVQSADESVAQLTACLAELKLADHTMVIITSDHGGLSCRGNKRNVATSNRPLRAGKGHLYEGGLRVPLIIRWPGEASTRISEQVVVGLDLFPTLAAVAGATIDAEYQLDGQSFAAELQGAAAPAAESRTCYWHNPAPRPMSTGDHFSSALRRGEWKLIEFPETQRVELYDLATDEAEANNLAQAEPERTAELLADLTAWRQQVGAAELRARRNPARQNARQNLRRRERAGR